MPPHRNTFTWVALKVYATGMELVITERWRLSFRFSARASAVVPESMMMESPSRTSFAAAWPMRFFSWPCMVSRSS